MTLKDKVANLPTVPGVYKFLDISGEIIYVGKARSLRNRVSSYFQSGIMPGTKTYALVSRINDIAYIQVQTELEALILESELIKKHQPKYNIVQKDDKSYLYIVFRKVRLPVYSGKKYLTNVFTARKTDLLTTDLAFGPYPDATTTKEIIRKLRKAFPYKDCSNTKYLSHRKRGVQCLYGDLGLCAAPCVANTIADLNKHANNTAGLKKVLRGESSKLIKELERKMRQSSKLQHYEDAANCRDTVDKFRYVSLKIRGVKEYIENPYLIDDLASQALSDIKNILPWLKRVPARIECYDISTTSGKEAVGSLVVAVDGKIDSREYKRFRIKLKNTPDDFGMLQEVLIRRLSHSYTDKYIQKWPRPDLIILDGGKGQLTAVLKIISDSDKELGAIGIEKKFETIVYRANGKFVEMRLPKDTQGMKLIIALRDEAHRFAQSYHHKLRSKTLFEKVL